jgi:tRNA(Ile)-lysidine synthase
VLGGDGMEELVVRTREPGDVIRPLGMAGRSKTLQDLFVDLRVPRAQREGWPVVVAGSQIVWVPGLRLAESARVTPSTTVVVEIEALPPPEVRGTV